MRRLVSRPVPGSWVGYLVSLLAVALVTVLIGFAQSYWRVANISMLYLIPVLAVAVAFGRKPAVFLSVAAFAAFNWFFVEPLHSLTVSKPEEWVALLLFLLTAISAGQLAANERKRAQEAEQREREAVVLYDLVRLMSDPDMAGALQAVAERLRTELGLAGVAVTFSDSGAPLPIAMAGDLESVRLSHPFAGEASAVLSEGRAPTEDSPGIPGRWVRIVPPLPQSVLRAERGPQLRRVPVKVGDRQVGELILILDGAQPAFGSADDRLLSAVAVQLGLGLERINLRRHSTDAEILRRSDELKSALLRAVSHDLRTPLASIIASAGSLLQSDVAWSEEERHDFAQAIEEEARRLNRIVGNLLDLSRIQAGSLQPEKGWYDLGSLVDELLARIRPLVANHRVVVDVQEDLPPLLLDYVEIDQVLTNLVENSVKYSPRGTDILIAVHRGTGCLEVTVADRGPGILEEELGQLFEPFYRSKDQRRSKGTGLGLAVAKGLVEAHGGHIWADNRQGGGAAFTFTLPVESEMDTSEPPISRGGSI